MKPTNTIFTEQDFKNIFYSLGKYKLELEEELKNPEIQDKDYLKKEMEDLKTTIEKIRTEYKNFFKKSK